MTPPALIPEHEFEEFLNEHGCYSKPKGGEHGIYRKSDDRLISSFGVRHRVGSKREVYQVYKKRFLKRLKEIEDQEKAAELEENEGHEESKEASDSYKESAWYKRQQEQQQELSQESTIETDTDNGGSND